MRAHGQLADRRRRPRHLRYGQIPCTLLPICSFVDHSLTHPLPVIHPVHIVRHPSLAALSTTLITPTPPPPTNPFLVSRESSLLQEFAFWPAKDNPALEKEDEQKKGQGVFELRSYELIPGTMLEWEGAWRRGIEARRRFIVSSWP